MVSFSEGLRDGMLTTGSFVTTMANPVLRIYSGTVPANAGASTDTATLLVTVTDNDLGAGNPLSFDTGSVSNGVLPKDPAQTWSGTVGSDGTATFFRIVSEGDTDGADTTAPRIQGRVSTAGSDLNLSGVTLTTGELRTINSFNVILPSQA